MMHKLTVSAASGLLALAGVAVAQTPAEPQQHTPQALYKITIVSRTTKALNYGYLSAPTRIDFAGTPLASEAKGEATIEPKRGSTLIQAKFQNVLPPTRFGAQYLTYVVWAISPEGRAQNLGELSLDGSNKGKLSTSTPMQTFAMIVTAEPYYSVTQPSDVVVMENMVGPGTIGKVEEVNATYELLPRKEYTYDKTAATAAGGKPVSREQYDAILAIYQAQNAIQIAESQNADRYAPERLARARELLTQARGYPSSLSQEIVSTAREAAQVAEDSRNIAMRRAQAERAATPDAERSMPRVTTQQEAPPPPPPPPPAETPAPAASYTPAPPPPAPAPSAASTQPAIEVNPSQFHRNDPQATENRRRLLASLTGPYETTDTPRGVMLVLPGRVEGGAGLVSRLNPVAVAVRSQRDLRVEVAAHSAAAEAASTQREAEAVRNALIAAGVPGDRILARGYGNSRPRASNATASGRAQNDRVEIVIAGDAIGAVPTWDRTYRIAPPGR